MFVAPLRYCGPIKNISGVIAISSSHVGQKVIGLGRMLYSSDKKGKCCKDVPQTEGRRVEPWPKAEPPATAWRNDCSREPQPPNYDPYRIKVPDVVVPPLPPSNAKPALECAKTKGPCTPQKVPDPPPCPPPPIVPFPWIYVYATAAFLAFTGLLYRYYLWKEEREKLSESKPIWRPRRKLKRPYHDKDLPACVQYLIVGTGAAGWAAYRAIQEYDKTAKVFFITKEDCLPYMRPPMSKQMWWNADPPDIKTLYYVSEHKRFTMYLADCLKFMDPIKFYRRKIGPALSIAMGWCVLRVDADEHVVYVKTMCGEQPIYYERCLLAPGSKAKNLDIFKSAPKAVRDKVSTLRTIRDLEIAFRRVREAKHVVVLGGGVLGTELAWHLGKMNEIVERPPETEPIEFVHMYKDRGILSSVVPEYLGEWAAEVTRCEHVKQMPKTQVYDAFMTPDGRLQLTLSDGSSLITDYVLVAVGTEPRVEMAEPSHLEIDRINGGFKVNTELEARSHLWVAGDAASIFSQWRNTRIRFEHYDNAEETGYKAGANMTGHWVPCNMEPHYWLRLGHVLDMEVVGEVGACMPIIALFKPCAEEEIEKARVKAEEEENATVTTTATVSAKAGGDKPCYKQSQFYRHRYKRGMLFYLRDETIVGLIFWNIPPVDDRKMVATEILRARPSYKDINMIAGLLGFPDTQCTYITAEELIDPGPCIKNWKVF